ncbi:hypothetical protein [Pararobbsia silviterrae]|uniref:Uncharacterized protein n=1 Tax=Pararobbsia silviterrae TaxID=1792498 RepID=A0A494Y668_9BURK|nr:hypothetical protein [Pararobbsia silviterrae]RKP57793.1 hypothetical protein D7S86_07630 [Pararobbsia silviterrae]
MQGFPAGGYFLEKHVRVPYFRPVVTMFFAAVACSACSSFDPTDAANADPKIGFERAQKLAQENDITCLWAWGADPKSGNYHCEPVKKSSHDDVRLSFNEMALHVVDGGVKLPDGAGTPLRMDIVDGKIQLTPQTTELQALSMPVR